MKSPAFDFGDFLLGDRITFLSNYWDSTSVSVDLLLQYFTMLSSKAPIRLSSFARTLATHASATSTAPATRHTWAKQEIQKIYNTPLLDLVYRAAAVHRQHHDPSKIQLCTLMNIKSMSITSDVPAPTHIYNFQLEVAQKIVSSS